MNNSTLSGRITRNPELRMIGTKATPTAFFTLAVSRDDGSNKSDFIPCNIRGDRAIAFVDNNQKGREVEVVGQLQTWKERATEGSNSHKDRWILNVLWFKSKAKPKGQSQTENQ
jgi:single-strand DNA-binding protein